MPRTSWKILGSTQVLAPSQADQIAIAEVLDAIDAAIAETDTLAAKLRLVRLGLIDDLLTRGVDGNGELRATGSLVDTPVGRRPAGWVVKPLGRLGLPDTPFVRTGPFGTTLQGVEWQAAGVPVVPIAAIGEDAIVKELLQHISEADAERLRAFAIRPDDILFSRVADVGRCVVVREEHAGWIMSSNLMRMTLDPEQMNADFVRLVLARDHDVRRQIRISVNAGGRDVVNTAILSALRMPMPPPYEQALIVSRAEAVDRRMRATATERAKLAALRDGLRDDLLTGRVRVAVAAEAAAE